MGRFEYESDIDFDKMYDWADDPDGFWNQLRTDSPDIPQNAELPFVENMLRDAGYEGLWVASTGGVAALKFTKTPVRQKNLTQPSLPELADFRPAAPTSYQLQFLFLAREAHGMPTLVMRSTQQHLGGGQLHDVIENVGGLMHRMTDQSGLMGQDFGFELIKPQIDSALAMLRHPDFAINVERGIASSSRNRSISVADADRNVRRAMNAYGDAHRKLRPFNKMQTAAQDAAVSISEFRFEDAIRHLEKIERELKQGRVNWAFRAAEITGG